MITSSGGGGGGGAGSSTFSSSLLSPVSSKLDAAAAEPMATLYNLQMHFVI